MKIWTNTFDDLYGQIDAIKGEAKRLGEANPDQKEVIAQNAIRMMDEILAKNNLSLEEWSGYKDTYDRYAQDISASPLQYGKGLLRSFGQGVLLGAGDELEAFVEHNIMRKLFGGADPDKTYQETLLDIQAGMKAFQDKHPGSDLTAEIIGGMFIPFYGTGLRGARYLTQKGAKYISNPANREAIAQGLTAGIASTLYGVGKDHELSAENALIGAGGGYVLNRALLGQGDMVRGARDRVKNAYRETGEQAGMADKLLAKVPAFPEAPTGSVGGPPKNLDPDSAPGAPFFKRGWDEMALKEIIQSADDEGVSFEELIKRVNDFTEKGLGEGVTLMDVVKERGPLAKTIRGLTMESPQASASYEEFLDRQISAKKRMLPKIFSLFDPQGKLSSPDVRQNMVRFLNKNKEVREKNAEPLYKQFDKLTLFDPRIDPNDVKNAQVNMIGEDLMTRIQRAMEYDDAIKRAWTKATGKLAFNDPAIPQHELDDFVLSGKRFNAFKKKLDGEIGKALREGDLESVKDLSEIKNSMIKQVDRIVELQTGAKPNQGIYQRARKIYSGGLAEDNAYEMGAGAIREHRGKSFTSDEFEVAFDGLNASERSFLRMGLASAYKDALLGDLTELTPNVRKLIVGGAEPNVLDEKFNYVWQDMTQATPPNLSGKERAKEFKNVLDKEGRFLKSFRYLWGGPGSAERMSEASSIRDKMSDVVESVADMGAEAIVTGGTPKYSLGRTIARNVVPDRLKTRKMVREKYATAIAERVLPMGDETVLKNLYDLQNFKRELDLKMGYGPFKSQGLLGRYSRPEIGSYNLLQTGSYTPPPIPIYPED